MGRESLDVLPTLAGWCGRADGSPRQCAIEMIFRGLEMTGQSPQERLRPRRGLAGFSILAGKEACLQLADPIPGRGMRQIRITSETVLDPKLVKLTIIKGSKCRRPSAKRPDQPELRGSDVNDEAEPRLPRKCEHCLGFRLRIGQRVARRQKVGDQVVAAVGHVSEVALLICHLQRTAQQITRRPDMSRPRQDESSETHIGPGLEPRQSVLFNQVIAEPAESKAGLVVAEARSGDVAEPHIGEARTVTVATLKAEIDRATDDQGKQ